MVIKRVFQKLIKIAFLCVYATLLTACSHDNSLSNIHNGFKPAAITYSFISGSFDNVAFHNKKVDFERKYETKINDKEYNLIIGFLLSDGELFSPFEEYPKNQQPILYVDYTDEKGVVQFFNIGTSWIGASGVDSFGESAHAMYHVSEDKIKEFVRELSILTVKNNKL